MGREAARAERVDALLVDEADAGGSVAEHLGLPFLSIAFFPPFLRSDRIPPFLFGWGGGQDWLSRLRNRIGLRLFMRLTAVVLPIVNKQRIAWGLKPLRDTIDSLSTLAQIAQLPICLEFVPAAGPEHLHYTGPFVDARVRPPVEFLWHRLDDRPLVYASLGTLQNGSEAIFKTIAQACDGLGVQLVLSLGGGLDPERLATLPGDPIVVAYAPQLEIIKRATLVITHAGLNTVLESLAAGVPMVALPQANDQPGVASRVAAAGAGLVVTSRKLNVARLREAVKRVLRDPKFRAAAKALQASIAEVDGLEKAADIIEATLGIKAEGKRHRRATLFSASSTHAFQPRSCDGQDAAASAPPFQERVDSASPQSATPERTRHLSLRSSSAGRPDAPGSPLPSSSAKYVHRAGCNSSQSS